jgi:hypothetical protein
MPITKEGIQKMQITAAFPIEARFPNIPQPAFEIMFSVRTEDGEVGEVYLEFSQRMGVGNSANKTQAQMSAETLASIGWTGRLDFSNIGNMAGKVCDVNAKKNDKGHMNLYFSSYSTTKLDPATLAQRVAALTGAPSAAAVSAASPFGAPAAPAAPFGAAPGAAAASPFGASPFPR